MKKSWITAIALVMVIALSLGVFTACDTKVKAISVVEGSVKTEYDIGETVDLTNAKIKVIYEDNTEKEIALTEKMFDKPIDTNTAGTKSYTITYEGAKTTLDITVNGEVDANKITIQTFNLPGFIRNYNTVSSTQGDADSNFKVQGNMYEVGNANALLLQFTASGLDEDLEEITINSGLKTTYKVEKSEDEGATYTELTGANLSEFVEVVDGYKYFFKEAAANKLVKLTVSLDSETYTIDEGVTDSHTITFKVIDGGYNVYDQDGLSVMNDLAKPEIWAEIWGCTVESGVLQAGNNPLQLAADTKPLYQYVGQVDWVILHGSITIDADKLPELYFWDKDRDASKDDGYCQNHYNTAKNGLVGKASEEDVTALQNALNGSFIEGNGSNSGGPYYICKGNADDNWNKGLYNTTKVSVSGNYNSITIPEERSAQGRLLKTVVSRNSGNTDKEGYNAVSQFFIFKMFEAKDDQGNYATPSTNFTLKNIALKGNGGKREGNVPRGMCMLNSFAYKTDIDNVVANGFYTNLGMDHYASHLVEAPLNMNISNSKMYDTYNAMLVTWRGAVDIKNSMLKDAGGPLFVLMDGTNRTPDLQAKKPSVTVDEATTMESMAMGNESWYAQLGSLVPDMFAELQTLDAGLSQISGKTFFTSKNGTGYTSVLTIMIPDAESALNLDGSNNYQFTGIMTFTGKSESSMEDTTFRTIANTLAGMNLGTVIFKSGDCYACVWNDTAGKRIIVSASMLLAHLQAYEQGQVTSPLFDTSSAEYLQGMAQMMNDWQHNSGDNITIWLQASQGSKTSPYIGIVLGDYHTVPAQA